MSNKLLDLDRLPTIEELRDFFLENDFSTATYIDIDYETMESDEVADLEYLKGLMGDKWDELSKQMGLKSNVCYYGKDNPLIKLRDSMTNLAGTGVIKLLDENPKRACEILEDFMTEEDIENPEKFAEKADKMLETAVSTLMQVTNYEEIAKVISENPASEDFNNKQNNFRAKDFEKKWNHIRSTTKVTSLEEIQINNNGDEIEINIEDKNADVFETVNKKLVQEKFWSKLTVEDKKILLLRMEGKTQKEIAECLGFKTHSTINKKLKKLQELFLNLN